jgi:hypothetical protein
MPSVGGSGVQPQCDHCNKAAEFTLTGLINMRPVSTELCGEHLSERLASYPRIQARLLTLLLRKHLK